ncbi:MAG: restriction endonuclease subunit S [Candidatus Moraniibacteriota bacterium]
MMASSKKTKYKETEIGPIPEEWEVSRLGDYFPIKTGKRDANFSSPDGNYPFFTCAQNILRCNEYSFEGDALLLSGNGDFNMKKYSGKFDAYQRTYVLIPHDKDERDFLFYAMKHHLPRITEGSRGSVISFLTKGMIEDFQFGCPTNKAERKKIAEILSSLDDKIELNRKMNKTLEEIAQALFKRWFVDFEFPVSPTPPAGGGEGGGGRGYKSSGGKMLDSELGLIPEGWNVSALSEVSNITIGRTPPRIQEQWFSLCQDDIKWISIRDLGNSGVYVKKTSEYLTREAVDIFKIPVIPKNTVIVSFKLTLGRVAITTEDMLSNEAIAHIRLKRNNLSTEYIYLALKRFDYSSLGSTSSIATAVNSQSVKSIPLLIPEGEINRIFSEIIKPLFERISKNSIEIDNLSIIRDSILPRLMNGKIRTSI